MDNYVSAFSGILRPSNEDACTQVTSQLLGNPNLFLIAPNLHSL